MDRDPSLVPTVLPEFRLESPSASSASLSAQQKSLLLAVGLLSLLILVAAQPQSLLVLSPVVLSL